MDEANISQWNTYCFFDLVAVRIASMKEVFMSQDSNYTNGK
jgi:hypothetical protein